MRTLLTTTAKLAVAVAATGGLLVAAPVAAQAGTATAGTTTGHSAAVHPDIPCVKCGF